MQSLATILDGFATRLAYLEQFVGRTSQLAGDAVPGFDPLLSAQSTLLSRAKTTEVLFGTVVDVVVPLHWYKVQAENGLSPIPCCKLSSTSIAPMGPKELEHLQPGTNVFFALNPMARHGVILGVVPPWEANSREFLPDWISQASRMGMDVDFAYSAPLNTQGKGGLGNYGSGRPLDASSGLEWGRITETGTAFLLDPFMAAMRVDEICGIFAFYHDQLLRVAGANLQVWSAAYDQDSLDDESELHYVVGQPVYPWEQQGRIAATTGDLGRLLEPQAYQIDEPHLSAIEPKTDKQQAFYRMRQFAGYLGQGYKRVLQTKNDSDQLAEYGKKIVLPGLFEEHVTMAGRYMLRSAKGVTLAKRMVIPSPYQLLRPEDPSGDNTTNYQMAGLNGNGDPHLVKDELATVDDTPAELLRAGSIYDLHSYIFNWEGCHPFHYHKKDWFLPNENDLGRTNIAPINFQSLSGIQYLTAPAPKKIPIDHRYGEASFYESYSMIDLLDDGGIVIGDGFGSEIRMTGGSIFLQCPGDVWLQPGRNVNAWAGYDAIIKAKNSIDVSATDHDVRVKAERNLLVMGGNDRSGGVLIENRGTGGTFDFSKPGEEAIMGGLALKSRGQMIFWGTSLYARTGGGDLSSGGDIVLDADKGQSTIRTHSQTFERYLTSYAADFFGFNGNVQAANYFAYGLNVLGSTLVVHGPTTILGPVTAGGNVTAIEGQVAHVASTDKVARADPQNWTASTKPAALQQYAQTKKNGTKLFEGKFTQALYAANRPGNDDVIRQVAFGFRTTKQYRTSDFALFEARWSQLAREFGGGTSNWTEKPARSGSENTFPYPGNEAMQRESYLKYDHKLFDVHAGNAKERGNLYEEAKYNTTQAVKLDGNYPVI